MSHTQSTATECYALGPIVILDKFWEDYRKQLLNIIFFHSSKNIYPPRPAIGDKVAETATGPKQNQMVAIKQPPTSPKYSPKLVKSR